MSRMREGEGKDLPGEPGESSELKGTGDHTSTVGFGVWAKVS